MVIGATTLENNNNFPVSARHNGEVTPITAKLLIPTNAQGVKAKVNKKKKEQKPIDLLVVETGTKGDHLTLARTNNPNAKVVNFEGTLTQDKLHGIIKAHAEAHILPQAVEKPQLAEA